MSEHYVLDDDHQPRAASWQEWLAFSARGFEETRRVARTEVGEASVSTVFLGIDHNMTGQGDPVLFETMVFGGEHADYQRRYTTWADAVAGHAETVAMVEAA